MGPKKSDRYRGVVDLRRWWVREVLLYTLAMHLLEWVYAHLHGAHPVGADVVQLNHVVDCGLGNSRVEPRVWVWMLSDVTQHIQDGPQLHCTPFVINKMKNSSKYRQMRTYLIYLGGI